MMKLFLTLFFLLGFDGLLRTSLASPATDSQDHGLLTHASPFAYCGVDMDPSIGGGNGWLEGKSGLPVDCDIGITSNEMLPFIETVESAPGGTTICLSDNLEIDFSNMIELMGGKSSIRVPQGVTIASGRRVGTGGALLFTNDFSFYNNLTAARDPLFQLGGNNVRFTGLRLRGPSQAIAFPQDGEHLHSVLKSKAGIYTAGFTGLEVDNCEFYGWPYVAVRVGGGYSASSMTGNRIHNSVFYNNRAQGLGYGVMIDTGYAEIFANVFMANRHAIAGTGKKGSGYEAHCNTILPGSTSHDFDMHAEGRNDGSQNAGAFIHIHHNDFQTVDKANVVIRGRPDEECRVEYNRFKFGAPGKAIRQQNPLGGFGNLLVWNNIYKTTKYTGWYVKPTWTRRQTDGFMKLSSSSDAIMKSKSPDVFDFNYWFGDFNGDGLTDIYKLENGNLYHRPHAASKGTPWNLAISTSHAAQKLIFGYFNDDDRTDVVYQNGRNILISNGATAPWKPLLTTSASLYSTLKIGDFDGNGVNDVMLASGSNWRVSYNTNSSWVILNQGTDAALESELMVGQFNYEDRKSDTFHVDGSYFLVSFNSTEAWTALASTQSAMEYLSIVDFDGDEISDVLFLRGRTCRVSLGATRSWKPCDTSAFPRLSSWAPNLL